MGRDAIGPVEERGEAEVDDGKKAGAFERRTPGAFLFLEAGHQRQRIEEQRVREHRREDAEGAEDIRLERLHADDEREGQSPEENGEAARQPPQGGEEGGMGRRLMHDEGEIQSSKFKAQEKHKGESSTQSSRWLMSVDSNHHLNDHHRRSYQNLPCIPPPCHTRRHASARPAPMSVPRPPTPLAPAAPQARLLCVWGGRYSGVSMRHWRDVLAG